MYQTWLKWLRMHALGWKKFFLQDFGSSCADKHDCGNTHSWTNQPLKIHDHEPQVTRESHCISKAHWLPPLLNAYFTSLLSPNIPHFCLPAHCQLVSLLIASLRKLKPWAGCPRGSHNCVHPPTDPIRGHSCLDERRTDKLSILCSKAFYSTCTLFSMLSILLKIIF